VTEYKQASRNKQAGRRGLREKQELRLYLGKAMPAEGWTEGSTVNERQSYPLMDSESAAGNLCARLKSLPGKATGGKELAYLGGERTDALGEKRPDSAAGGGVRR